MLSEQETAIATHTPLKKYENFFFLRLILCSTIVVLFICRRQNLSLSKNTQFLIHVFHLSHLHRQSVDDEWVFKDGKRAYEKKEEMNES